MEPFEDDRDANRNQREETEGYYLARKHVGIETDGERQNSGGVTENLDRKKQDGQHEADRQRHALLRTDEMLQVPDRPIFAHALVVIVEPRQERASERHDGYGRGRLQARNQSYEITYQDEQTERDQIRDESFGVAGDRLSCKITDEPVDAFHRMLQAAGLLDRKLRANEDKERRQQQHHQNFHRERLADGSNRIVRDVQRAQQCGDGCAEQLIQQTSKGQLMHDLEPAPSFERRA